MKEVTLNDIFNVVVSMQADIKKLDNKIENVEQRLTKEIQDVDERLTKQIQDVDERLTKQIQDVDERLTIKMNTVDLRFKSLKAEMMASEIRLRTQIVTTEKNLKAYINKEIKMTEDTVKEYLNQNYVKKVQRV